MPQLDIPSFVTSIEQFVTELRVPREVDQNLALCSLAISAKRIADAPEAIANNLSRYYIEGQP